MKRIYIFTLVLLLLSTGAFAQNNFFQTISPGAISNAREAANQVKKKGIFRLNEQAMRSYLLRAPLEFKNNGRTLPLEIPLPNGKTEIFNMVESPVLSAKVAAEHPEIKTYTGNGTTDKKSVIRLSLTSSGFNAIILNVDGDAVYFESYSKVKSDIYYNYFVRDIIVPKGPKRSSCAVGINETNAVKQQAITNKIAFLQATNPMAFSTGGTLTTFRLAMPADAEFVAHNGGTVNSGFNAVLAYVNRIVAFYRNELSVSFVLVSGTNMIYTNANTDPYDNDDQIAMLDQNQANCDAVLGNNGYDIGHVWGYAGSSGGGIASSPSVCDDSYKGQGVSGEGDLTVYSQAFMDQLVFHEMGHQFGMSHSYNSSIPVCTTRKPETSVEPGSGATVMSYGFTCSDNTGDDDYYSAPVNGLITGPILQFHTVSYQQAVAYMSTISCGVTTATGNTPPVVTMPSNYTIPKSTPFALTGSATDADNDALTYCWDGTNTGGDAAHPPNATTLANTAKAPFSRSYSPSTSGTRIFPVIESILDGTNYVKGDKLPSVGVNATYNLTVRDNNASGGGVSFGSVTVTVDGNVGPFLETTNLSGSYAGGSEQSITWSVNGTDAATPNVKISLSTDGGYTFPTVLLASTPNDGNESITLPDVVTTTARIKVEAVGNIFFDISNSNFSINSNALTTITTSAISPTTYCAGASMYISFTTNGVANAGNVFTAQGSNASGSFAHPTVIGTLSSTTDGNILATAPAGSKAGSGYRVRVVSSNPAVTGSDNGTNITIKRKPVDPQIAGAASVVAQASNVAYSVTNVKAGETYNWTASPSSIKILSGQGTSSVTVKFGNASGSIYCKASNECGGSRKIAYPVTVTSASIALNENSAKESKFAQQGQLFKLSPVPARDEVKITFSAPKQRNYKVELTDMAGKVLLTKNGISAIGTNVLTFNVANYTDGMYFVNLIDADGRKTLKMVKIN